MIQKSYCCRLGGNKGKIDEISSVFSSINQLSRWIYDNKIFLDEKDFYKACREQFPSLNSKITQNTIKLYKENNNIFKMRDPINCPIIFDNQIFNIKFKEKYFDAFIRIASSVKGKRINVPLVGKWPIKKLQEAKKINEVKIAKHSNGCFYAHIIASFECKELIKSGKHIGLDQNVKNISLSNNKTYSLREFVHRKIESKRGKSAKKKDKNYSKNFLHKVTTKIVRDLREEGAEVLHLEDLHGIRGKKRGKKLNFLVNNSFPTYQFQSMLTYKLTENGIGVIKNKNQTINSSRKCSRCGSLNTIRPTRSQFRCLNCFFSVNADFNAARNIGCCISSAGGAMNNLPLHAPKCRIPHGKNHVNENHMGLAPSVNCRIIKMWPKILQIN